MSLSSGFAVYCVIMIKLLILSGSQFPHIKMEIPTDGAAERTEDIRNIKCSLSFSHSIRISYLNMGAQNRDFLDFLDFLAARYDH